MDEAERCDDLVLLRNGRIVATGSPSELLEETHTEDLEAAFLFPWAVSLDLTGWPGWITMMVFLGELAIGLAYAWKMGALDWE